MFHLTHAQRVDDRDRQRAVWFPSRFECRYEREGRSVTLFCEPCIYVNTPEEFISATGIRMPKQPNWDDTKTPLNAKERDELMEDLKSAFRVMSDRLEIVDDDDVRIVLYQSDPEAARRGRAR